MLLKCDFCEEGDFENEIFVKNCYFINVNFAKNAILKM